MKTRTECQRWADGRVALVEPGGGGVKGQVVFVHGLSEHAGRPLPFARQLAGQGYRTVVVELAGHGAPDSAARDMAWLYEAYASTSSAGELLQVIREKTSRSGPALRRVTESQYELLKGTDARRHLTQIAATIEATRRLDPALPVFLVGHSMGGLLCVESAWRWSERPDADLRGVALLSPALKPTPPHGKPLEKLLFDTVWTLRRAPISLIRGAVKGALNLNLPLDTTAGNRWLSDQRDEVELYARDPLVPHKIPTRYLSSIESVMVDADRRGPRFPVPGIVLVPERDGITSADAGAGFARAVQRAMGGERMQLEQPAVCAHDLLRSSARDRVAASIVEWLDREMRPAAARSVDHAA